MALRDEPILEDGTNIVCEKTSRSQISASQHHKGREGMMLYERSAKRNTSTQETPFRLRTLNHSSNDFELDDEIVDESSPPKEQLNIGNGQVHSYTSINRYSSQRRWGTSYHYVQLDRDSAVCGHENGGPNLSIEPLDWLELHMPNAETPDASELAAEEVLRR